MYKEYKNFLNKEEKNTIKHSILNNRLFPFYWSQNQTLKDYDPFFYHCIKDPYHGEEIISKEMYSLFEPILKRFCNKYKYTYNYLIRASINLTVHLKNKIGGIHKDHEFKYQSIIIYLNDCKDGYTYIYNNDKKVIAKIKPEQYKILYMDDVYHSASFPKHGRRVICVMTFK